MMKIVFFLTLLTFASCSLFSPDPEAPSKERTYSHETDKAFEAIERAQVKNHVEDLHTVNVDKAKMPNQSAPKKEDSAKRIREVKLKGTPSTVRELNQVLSYHCMKHRKRFDRDEICHAKVNHSLDRCEEKHQKVTADFVRCLKDELKRI